jgi:hypothetical protein
MKARLEFNLDDSDDSMAFDRASKSLDLCLALWDFNSRIRSLLKYPAEGISDEVYSTLETIQDEFQTCLSDHGIILDKLIN